MIIEKDEAENPTKLSHNKWIQWEESIVSYFSAIKISRDIPLTYVIRNHGENSYEATSDVRDE